MGQWRVLARSCSRVRAPTHPHPNPHRPPAFISLLSLIPPSPPSLQIDHDQVICRVPKRAAAQPLAEDDGGPAAHFDWDLEVPRALTRPAPSDPDAAPNSWPSSENVCMRAPDPAAAGGGGGCGIAFVGPPLTFHCRASFYDVSAVDTVAQECAPRARTLGGARPCARYSRCSVVVSRRDARARWRASARAP